MNSKIKKLACVPYSIYFNFRYLPFKIAKKCPILISPFGDYNISGKIAIEADTTSFGMIKIGVSKGSFNLGHDSCYIRVEKDATVRFKGLCQIAKGVKLSATKGGVIEFGVNTDLNANCIVSSNSLVSIGDYSWIGWNSVLMDWDGHNIMDVQSKNIKNNPRPIILERCCWIGANCNVMKGVTLSHHSIVPTRTVLTKSNDTPYAVFGGSPNRILKEGIIREEFLDK